MSTKPITTSSFDLKQTVLLYRQGKHAEAAKLISTIDQNILNAIHGKLWQGMGRPNIPNFGNKAFNDDASLDATYRASSLDKAQAIESYLSEIYQSINAMDALKVNQELFQFNLLLKDPVQKPTFLFAAFKALPIEIQNTLCLYVWIAFHRPTGVDPQFGQKKIEENPRLLLNIQDAEGKNLLEQLIHHFQVKARLERNIKEAEDFLTLLKNQSTTPAELAAVFKELDPEALQGPLCREVWIADGSPNQLDYGRHKILENPRILLERNSKRILEEQIAVLKKSADFPLPKARDLIMLNPECDPYVPQDVSLAHVTRILGASPQPYAGGVTVVAYEFGKVLSQGGLGVAIHGLAEGLAKSGLKVRVILPKFDILPTTIASALKEKPKYQLTDTQGKAHKVFKMKLDGLKCYFIEDTEHFTIGKTDGGVPKMMYGPDHNTLAVRFVHFSSHATDLAFKLRAKSPVLHVHEWHTALIPKLMRRRYPTEWTKGQTPATLFTFHNNLHHAQGILEGDAILKALEATGNERAKTNAFVEAVWYSDMSSTVSPTFAEEVQVGKYGMQIDPILRSAARIGKFTGILNGNHLVAFDPKTDPMLKAWVDPITGKTVDLTFGPNDDIVAKKLAIKQQLQNWLRFHHHGELDLVTKPLIFYLGRYDSSQKGVELFETILESTLAQGGQFISLGIDPDDTAKKYLAAVEKKIPIVSSSSLKAGAIVLVDDKLPNGKRRYQQEYGLGPLLRAAADYTIIPSKIEPCGLVPPEANRMGSLVIASRAGGLADNVITKGALMNGFLFDRVGWEDHDWHSENQKLQVRNAIKDAISFWKGLSKNDKNELMKKMMLRMANASWIQAPGGEGMSPVEQYRLVFTTAVARAKQRQILPLTPPLLK